MSMRRPYDKGQFKQRNKTELDVRLDPKFNTEEVNKSGHNLFKRRRLFDPNTTVGLNYVDSKIFDARFYNYILAQLINKNANLTLQLKILGCIDPEKWEELLGETDLLAGLSLVESCSEPFAFYKVQARMRSFSPVQKAFSYNGDTETYTDETTTINEETANDVALPPIQIVAIGDAIYFGSDEIFSIIKINVGTIGDYSGITLEWQYWNGVAWTALADIVDDTVGFTVIGIHNVTYTLPTDWAKTAVNGTTTYWIRCVVTALPAPVLTTAPLGTQAWLRGVRAKVMAYMSGYNK